MSDVPAAILVTLMVWMLIEGHQRQSFSWIIGAGLVWGAATLVRPVPLAYAPAIILWLVLVMPSWKRSMAASFAVLISFVCVLAPWSIRNTRVHGEFVALSTQAGGELFVGNHPGATGVLAADQPYFQDKLDQRYPKHQFNEVTRHKLFKADAINFIPGQSLAFRRALCNSLRTVVEGLFSEGSTGTKPGGNRHLRFSAPFLFFKPFDVDGSADLKCYFCLLLSVTQPFIWSSPPTYATGFR